MRLPKSRSAIVDFGEILGIASREPGVVASFKIGIAWTESVSSVLYNPVRRGMRFVC
jgi:hypothetical protein